MSKAKKVVYGIIGLILTLLVLSAVLIAAGQVLQIQHVTQVGNVLFLGGLALALLFLFACVIGSNIQ